MTSENMIELERIVEMMMAELSSIVNVIMIFLFVMTALWGIFKIIHE